MGSPFAMKHRRNPMSIGLHSSLAPCEMPSVSSLRDKASKIGHLKKLSGKGILTSGTWRDRFCLLVKNKLYYYESEESEGADKACGFVNLEYFDTCTEASTRMARKATNVFVIGSSDKGFFESHSGRHYFAAETLPEMKDWVNAINAAMKSHIRSKEKRTGRDGSLTPGQTKRDSGKMKVKEDESPTGTLPRSGVRLDHVTKDRVRGPQGRRLPRKPNKSLGAELTSTLNNRDGGGPDSLMDSADEEISNGSSTGVRDARGRATSLSALESSSETHPKVSNEKGGEHTHKFDMPWGSPRIGENKQDATSTDNNNEETQEIDLIYSYSSSEDDEDDSDEEEDQEENNVQQASGQSSNIKDSGRKSSLKSSGSGGSFQKRPQSRSGSRMGAAILRNSSVTPPPCVLRKYRRDQMNGQSSPLISSGGLKGTDSSKNFKGRNKGREESPSPLLPEFDSQQPQRTSSGSSLSTLTADTYSQIGGAFSSLQRRNPLHNNSGAQSNRNSGIFYSRPSASANASPLMNGHSNGNYRNGYASHNNSPSSTINRNSVNMGSSAGTSKGFQIERNLFSVTKELEAIQQETKSLDAEVTGLRQDVGIVQENIVTVRGAVDNTKDRVNKLQNQVSKIERQVASILEEANEMKEQAHEFLQAAQQAKAMQDTLLEEAQNLVGFLRQSASFVPTSPYMHQHNYGHFQPQYCAGPSPIPPPYFGQQSQQQQPPRPLPPPGQSTLRKKPKDPNNGDVEADMETLNESVLQNHGNMQGNNAYYDSLGVKSRNKAKSVHSNASSSSGSSAGNRGSVLEPLERKPGSKSPEGGKGNEQPKISHL